MKNKACNFILTIYSQVLTQLSVLKVKLAETYENGTWSSAATAPASLLFIIASYATDEGTSEAKLDSFLETSALPTKMGASRGPWQLNTAVIEPANWSREKKHELVEQRKISGMC